jgi:hypothetical protein
VDEIVVDHELTVSVRSIRVQMVTERREHADLFLPGVSFDAEALLASNYRTITLPDAGGGVHGKTVNSRHLFPPIKRGEINGRGFPATLRVMLLYPHGAINISMVIADIDI